MSNITVRFVHRRSHTPVLELEGVEASATVGALRERLMERLASEEECMMRVFVKWHAKIALSGGMVRLTELTDEDTQATLHSVGISHLSEVHLDGPLTGDSREGVGQALAVLGAQMHRMDKGQSRLATLLETLVAQNAGQLCVYQLALLHSEAHLARQGLAAEEGLAYGQLMASKGLAAEIRKASIEALHGPIPFTIDRTTPHKTFIISDDGTTATKIADGDATFRTSKLLTATNHKYAIKIVEDVGDSGDIIIGLLPNLSNAQVAKMEGSEYIGTATLDQQPERGDLPSSPINAGDGCPRTTNGDVADSGDQEGVR